MNEPYVGLLSYTFVFGLCYWTVIFGSWGSALFILMFVSVWYLIGFMSAIWYTTKQRLDHYFYKKGFDED